MTPLTSKITEAKILQVVAGGFVLVLLTTLAVGLVGLGSIRSIQSNANELVTELRLSSDLIAEIQRQLGNLSAISHRLAKDPDAVDSERLLAQVTEAETSINRMATAARATSAEPLWERLVTASKGFSEQVRRVLEQEHASPEVVGQLFERHEKLLSSVSALINLSYRRAVQAQGQIDRQSRRLARQALYVVGACMLVAVLLAVSTLLLAARLIQRMEEQSSELSRVSWHLLENQEVTARRFSHELHDELGQSLTAVKANLAALSASAVPARQRIQDCVALVDEAIENVREMSLLLHPRILDDFGLDAALRSLGERFGERTNIKVAYESNLDRHLPSHVSTHLFRIAQEALTNVARHSKADVVRVRLWHNARRVSLSVEDNGMGFPSDTSANMKGLGLVTMGARARNLGGNLTIAKGRDGGVRIEVTVPARRLSDVKEDPYPAGR